MRLTFRFRLMIIVGMVFSGSIFSEPRTQTDLVSAKKHVGRSAKAKAAFRRAVDCPTGARRYEPCEGYVIDHVVPLCMGGRDAPENMQWQTKHEAKIKDRTECRFHR